MIKYNKILNIHKHSNEHKYNGDFQKYRDGKANTIKIIIVRISTNSSTVLVEF